MFVESSWSLLLDDLGESPEVAILLHRLCLADVTNCRSKLLHGASDVGWGELKTYNNSAVQCWRSTTQSCCVLVWVHLSAVLLHVPIAVLVCVDQFEREVVNDDACAHVQVTCRVVLAQLDAVALLAGLLDATALQEFAADDSCVYCTSAWWLAALISAVVCCGSGKVGLPEFRTGGSKTRMVSSDRK